VACCAHGQHVFQQAISKDGKHWPFLLKTVATVTEIPQLISVCSHKSKFISKKDFIHIDTFVNNALFGIKFPFRLMANF
jgi:hypothetical protein